MWCQLAPLLACVLAILLSFAFVGFFIVCLLWLPPLLIKQSFRGDAFVEHHANESINFELFWLILEIPILIVGVLFSVFTLGLGAFLVVPAIAAIGIFQLVVMIMASVAASNGQWYRYPLVGFRLVK